MSDLKICERCGELVFDRFRRSGECDCREFSVIDEDGEQHHVHSTSEMDAALKYAEKSNSSGDYYLMNSSVVIEVNGTKYSISAEPDIHYSAKRCIDERE